MFRFPRTKFVAENTIKQQLSHILSEAVEVQDAVNEEPGQRIAEELVDLIHSAETGLRVLQERDGININDIWLMVSTKNSRRGYYA